LDRCDAAVLLMPGGKSAHLELGYTIGKGKPGFIVFDEEPERYDVMTQFATEIFFSKEEFFSYLQENRNAY
jgi:nucleoside 2-deoxyribosyltransferase